MGAAQVTGRLSRQALLRVKMELEVQKHRLNKTVNNCVKCMIKACPCCAKFQAKVTDRNMKETFEEVREGLEDFFELIGFDDLDAWAMYQHFCLIDDDLSNTIDMQEFFDYFELPMSPFVVAAFNSFDMDDDDDSPGHLNLDYGEFVAAVWNFCTFDHGQLVEFAFKIYDVEGEGEIDIKTLTEQVHNSVDVEGDLPELMAVVTEFDADASGTIDFEEFRRAEKEYRMFIQPAFDLQRVLRRKIEGVEFWIDATLRRHSKIGPTGINVMQYFQLIRDGEELPDIEINGFKSIGVVTVKDDDLDCPGYERELIGSKCRHCRRDIVIHPPPPPLVYEEPDNESEVVESRQLELDEKVHIYEHRLDQVEAGKIWYLINENGKEWVSQECVAIDYEWLQQEALKESERQRVEREARREKKKRLEYEAEVKELDETYDMLVDQASGRVYWLNKLTLVSSYDDPYKAVELDGVNRRRAEQAKKDEEAREKEEKQQATESKNSTTREEEAAAARVKPFDVRFVMFMGNKFRLREFAVDATVADVKKEVEDITDIGVLEQRLFLEQTELTDMSAVLLETGFERDGTLKLATTETSHQEGFDEWLAKKTKKRA